jgi:predicted dehydrogenase
VLSTCTWTPVWPDEKTPRTGLSGALAGVMGSPAMDQVVLVGCGRAGKLHLDIGARCSGGGGWPPPRIVALVDPRIDHAKRLSAHWQQHTGTAPLLFGDLGDALDCLDVRCTLVDICAPNPLHRPLAQLAVERGVTRVLLEKPMFTRPEELAPFNRPDLSIAGVHNYLYSGVTRKIRHLIRQTRLVPEVAELTSHKDRRPDSARCRGFLHGVAPHALEIELPHLLYLAQTVFGHVEVTACRSWPMVLNGTGIQGHGGAEVLLRNRCGVRMRGSSSLMAPPATCGRRVRILCRGGVEILGLYPRSGSSVRRGRVEIRSASGHLLQRWSFHEDCLADCLRTLLPRLGAGHWPSGVDPVGADVARLIAEARALEEQLSKQPTSLSDPSADRTLSAVEEWPLCAAG